MHPKYHRHASTFLQLALHRKNVMNIAWHCYARLGPEYVEYVAPYRPPLGWA